MPYVYMLRCADDSLYVGSTRSIEHRVEQHRLGRVDSYTRQHRPVELVWCEEVHDVGEAAELERRIKGWRRSKKLALIAGRFTDLPALSTAGSHRDGDPHALRQAQGA